MVAGEGDRERGSESRGVMSLVCEGENQLATTACQWSTSLEYQELLACDPAAKNETKIVRVIFEFYVSQRATYSIYYTIPYLDHLVSGGFQVQYDAI